MSRPARRTHKISGRGGSSAEAEAGKPDELFVVGDHVDRRDRTDPGRGLHDDLASPGSFVVNGNQRCAKAHMFYGTEARLTGAPISTIDGESHLGGLGIAEEVISTLMELGPRRTRRAASS